jgi:PDZ domain-containing protein
VTTPKVRALTLCAALIVALLAVAAFVPLPYTVTRPGVTADTLGAYEGNQVLTITGTPTRATSGQLRATTISADNAGERNSLWTVLSAYLNQNEAVVPTDAVYPHANPAKAQQETTQQMVASQDSATEAALNFLHLSPDQVKVKVDLGDIGGPSAGQMLTLGIIDKIAGNGKGGDLSGGRVIAGTGTVDGATGAIGAVGGVPLKTQAAARDGATVFLLPRSECSDAKVNTPAGLRLVPVTTITESVAALEALDTGGPVPSC